TRGVHHQPVLTGIYMETFFLVCFAFGALFTLASFALGMAGHGAAHVLHGHAPPHVGSHGISHPNGGHGIGHAEGGHAVGHHVDGAHSGHADTVQHVGLPLLNFSSALGALTWFGAAGYLLVRLGAWALPAVVLGALL